MKTPPVQVTLEGNLQRIKIFFKLEENCWLHQINSKQIQKSLFKQNHLEDEPNIDISTHPAQ